MKLHDRRFLLAAALAALPAGLASSPGRAAPAARTYVIRLDKMKFGPLPKGLRVGDVIVWANDDFLRHTATARNGAFDVDLKPGARGRVVLKAPGEIVFYCRYHPGMTGRLVVAR
jgi:plastocyanin